VDFHHIFTAQQGRHQSLPAVAHELGVAIHVFSALLFLQQALGVAVDADLLATLERRSQTIGARLRYYVGTPVRGKRNRRKRRWAKTAIEARLTFLSYCFGPQFHLDGKAQ